MTHDSSLGYLIGNDQYFKRDDLGIVYQINVVPGKRRGLIGASLLKAQFERSAYGCKLYCCWCAQDIEANRFWESMGFVPLAYRAGSLTKGKRREAGGVRGEDTTASDSSLTPHASTLTPRVHIFWQKRIRTNDASTPFWFPSKTSAGSIREDRIVLPIRAGTPWSEAQPLILPGDGTGEEGAALGPAGIEGPMDCTELKKAGPRKRSASGQTAQRPPAVTRGKEPVRCGGGLRFAPVVAPEPVKERPKRTPKAKQKTDSRLEAAARELHDRWLEEINTTTRLGQGKYDLSRALPTRETLPRLTAA